MEMLDQIYKAITYHPKLRQVGFEKELLIEFGDLRQGIANDNEF